MLSFNPYLKKSKEYALVQLQREAARRRENGEHIINLTIGDPKDSTYDQTRLAIKDFMEETENSQYPSPYEIGRAHV